MKIETGVPGVATSTSAATTSRSARTPIDAPAPAVTPDRALTIPDRHLATEVRQVSRAELERVIEKLNKASEAFNRELRFSIHEKTRQIVVRVVDSEGEVIREIPPEKVLDAFAMMQDALGLLLDAKV